MHGPFAKGVVDPKNCRFGVVGPGGIAHFDFDRSMATAQRAGISFGNGCKFFVKLDAYAFPQAPASENTEDSAHAATNIDQDILGFDPHRFHVSAQQYVINHLVFAGITERRRELEAWALIWLTRRMDVQSPVDDIRTQPPGNMDHMDQTGCPPHPIRKNEINVALAPPKEERSLYKSPNHTPLPRASSGLRIFDTRQHLPETVRLGQVTVAGPGSGVLDGLRIPATSGEPFS